MQRTMLEDGEPAAVLASAVRFNVGRSAWAEIRIDARDHRRIHDRLDNESAYTAARNSSFAACDGLAASRWRRAR